MINSNLFWKEMSRNIAGLLLWMFVIALLISITMAVYPTFLANQSKVLAMMALVPKGALQFKGISNVMDLLSILGFYAANNVIYMMVLGSVFSIVYAVNILLKEEYQKTAEYLLTRPLTRTEIFMSKLSVLMSQIILLNLVATLVGFFSMKIVQEGPVNFSPFFILSTYTFLLNVFFGAVGLFMSTLVKRPKPITTFSIAMVLLFYFIFTISKITEGGSKIGYLSPFKYVNMDVMNPDYHLSNWHLLFFAGGSLVLLFSAHRIYKRKDIYT